MVELSKRKFLLTDTVGFIDRLPLTLIEAFHSTLEETIYTDLIILVLDVSEPFETVERKNAVCLETIDRIGASGIPLITALNKIDLVTDAEAKQKLDRLQGKIKNPVLISALYGTNTEALKEEILKKFEDYVQASFTVPLVSKTMQFLSWVHNGANVKKTSYVGDSVQVIFEASPSFAENVRKRVEGFGGRFETNRAVQSTQQE
jgi:GTP-binding protein HflX